MGVMCLSTILILSLQATPTVWGIRALGTIVGVAKDSDDGFQPEKMLVRNRSIISLSDSVRPGSSPILSSPILSSPNLFFFGQSGAGKTYCGETAASLLPPNVARTDKYLFIDADAWLPKDMKAATKRRDFAGFTQEDRNKYMDAIAAGISQLKTFTDRPLLVSQAVFKRQNRDQIRKVHPDTIFVWVRLTEQDREKRLDDRLEGAHGLAGSTAGMKMAKGFEPPLCSIANHVESCFDGRSPVLVLENEVIDDEELSRITLHARLEQLYYKAKQVKAEMAEELKSELHTSAGILFLGGVHSPSSDSFSRLIT